MSFNYTLKERLRHCLDHAPEWQPVYDDFVGSLRTRGVGRTAPAVGSRFPRFALPDFKGQYCDIGDLIADGPLVVSFNRGRWCPYCVQELESWGVAANELRHVQGRFAAITAEVDGQAEAIAAMLGQEAAVLCDIDHGVALELGLAFHCDTDLQRRYVESGLDLASIYGTTSGFLPVPATFVIDREGIVRFTFADPDFRLRAEPETVIRVVAELTGHV
jgi:peroxiredoxin